MNGGLRNSGGLAGTPSIPTDRSRVVKGRKACSYRAYVPAKKPTVQFPGFIRTVQLSCYPPPAHTGYTEMDLLSEVV